MTIKDITPIPPEIQAVLVAAIQAHDEAWHAEVEAVGLATAANAKVEAVRAHSHVTGRALRHAEEGIYRAVLGDGYRWGDTDWAASQAVADAAS